MEPPAARSTQLAAIMFTDIAGYSRLMEEDEQRTIAVLKEHNEIVFPLIDAAGGDVIDAIGDGLLILFPTVRDAVTCAGSIHDAVAAHNDGCSPGHRFTLRIGIHLGEIWREQERVYGNGVNVAARVQPFAAPGGICITEDVHRLIANKVSLPMTSIGPKSLKNISRTIELFHIQTGHEEPEEVEPRPPAVSGRPNDEHDEVAQLYETAKEHLIREREAATERHGGTANESRLETRIESKIFGLVEHVMDRAMDKWESMPEEKRAKTIQAIRTEIQKEGGHLDISIGDGHHRKHRHDREKSESSDALSTLATGTVFGVGFGLGTFAFGIGWMVWPFAILGALPFSVGLVKAVKQLVRRHRDAQARPQAVERTVLSAAKRLGGKVSVVQISSHTDLSLDDAQSALDRMAAKGYVNQHIDPDGVISYEFPMLVTTTQHQGAADGRLTNDDPTG